MPFEIADQTYGQAIIDISKYVGHSIPADAAGSTDPAHQQMGAAINFALEQLLTLHEWQQLIRRDSISIVADTPGQTEKGFDLPEDFDRFVDMTQWSAGSSEPAGGPVSSQAWQAHIVRNNTMQLTLYWQLREGQLWVLNPPDVAVDFEFMYISKAQVVDEDDPAIFKNRASKNGDTFLLDSFMVTLLGRYHYLSWKGFDTAAADNDFTQIFEARVGANKGSATLSLVRNSRMPLISPIYSVPDTGFGS